MSETLKMHKIWMKWKKLIPDTGIDVAVISAMYEYSNEDEFKPLNLDFVSESFYCQREIECKSKCDKQCDHCKEYYAPIERQ